MSSSADYDTVARGSLKLKKPANKSSSSSATTTTTVTKKIQKSSTKERETKRASSDDRRTDAEKKHDAMLQERELAKLKAEAKVSHRQRVQKLNSRLENMPAHNDIPRIGPG